MDMRRQLSIVSLGDPRTSQSTVSLSERKIGSVGKKMYGGRIRTTELPLNLTVTRRNVSNKSFKVRNTAQFLHSTLHFLAQIC